MGSGCNPPFFISFSAEKNVIIAYIARNSRDLVWGHNLDLGTCKKKSSHLEIGITYMLQRGRRALAPNHALTLGLLRFMWWTMWWIKEYTFHNM